MQIGFTGTRRGMSAAQAETLRTLLRNLKREPEEGNHFYHGDCKGADEQAHNIALEEGYRVYIFPPTNPKNRAYCQGAEKVFPEAPYLERNKLIVHMCSYLIGVPAKDYEELRSGTWSAIRYARKIGVSRILIYPNGDSWRD